MSIKTVLFSLPLVLAPITAFAQGESTDPVQAAIDAKACGETGTVLDAEFLPDGALSVTCRPDGAIGNLGAGAGVAVIVIAAALAAGGSSSSTTTTTAGSSSD